MSRRDFGSVRRRASGRWQVRYRDPVGRGRSRTFLTRGDAARYLAALRTDIDRGEWFDPLAGRQQFRDYASRWLATRRVRGRPLAPRTRERYAGLLGTRICPILGHLQLRQLDASAVRGWYAVVTGPGGPGPATAAKAYRLLHAICATAVVDGEMSKIPVAIPGASTESNPERPIATLGQIYALTDAVAPRWRALVLLATFCALRFGELAGLTRDRLDLLHGTVTVTEDLDELDDGTLQRGDVKSAASRRSVAIPAVIVPDLERHLAAYADLGPEGLVFIGPNGGSLRRGNFRRSVWLPAINEVGLVGLRFNDLRHTGNTLAAATGASTRELMARMGHASSRAALIYQHATRDRDVAIAAALSDLVTGALTSSRPAVVPLLRRQPGPQAGNAS